MAGYTVLATRYRPRVFGDVVGQEDAARVLRAGLAGGRSAHAYLFSGPRGVGKTSMARILAKAWNCLTAEGEPCGTCAVCRAIDEGADALDVVEIDGASHNRVENVRELIETLRFRPLEARYRVTIVDEVHMLSTSAFNALLKTLEEPPSHAKFILATTEPLKVPETIRSRCQLIDFRRLAADEIAARLAAICGEEKVTAPPGLLERIARHARGGLRDALSLLDQLIAYGDGQPTVADFERLTGRLSPQTLHALLGAALAGDTAAALAAGSDALARGARPADLVEQLTELAQGLLVTAAGGQPADRTSEEQAALRQLAKGASVDQLVAMLDVLVEAAARLRQRHDGRLVVELALVTLARVPLLQDVADVLAGRGGAAPARPATPPTAAPTRPAAPAPATRPAAAPQVAPARPGPQPPAAPAPAPRSEAGDFSARFIEAAARGSRSLRADLQRYGSIRVEGDDLVLQPSGGAPLFDPREPQIRQRLLDAAREVSGRTLGLRVLPAAGSSGARPASPPPGRAAGGGDLDQRILGDWPGSERVDF
jgi:DNA polymerase-3 subunit gamma/tau